MRVWLAVMLLALGIPAMAASRVVSLAPSLTEMMLELGAADLLVGRLDAGESSPALADVPSVGRYGQLNMERLLSLQPDLILLWPGSVGAAQREQLHRLNLPTQVIAVADEPDFDRSMDWVAGGVFSVLTRPLDPTRLQRLALAALENRETFP